MYSGLTQARKVLSQLERVENSVRAFPFYVYRNNRGVCKSIVAQLEEVQDMLSLIVKRLEEPANKIEGER